MTYIYGNFKKYAESIKVEDRRIRQERSKKVQFLFKKISLRYLYFLKYLNVSS